MTKYENMSMSERWCAGKMVKPEIWYAKPLVRNMVNVNLGVGKYCCRKRSRYFLPKVSFRKISMFFVKIDSLKLLLNLLAIRVAKS